MDEFWDEFCNAIAGALGELFVRALFTKTGFIVALPKARSPFRNNLKPSD